jgi:hypothetical protein
VGGLTWAQLTAPEYVMTFLEGFLLASLPALGLGNAVEGSGMIDTTAFPSALTMLGAGSLGVLNGIRSLRNLRAPSPEARATAESAAKQ